MLEKKITVYLHLAVPSRCLTTYIVNAVSSDHDVYKHSNDAYQDDNQKQKSKEDKVLRVTYGVFTHPTFVLDIFRWLPNDFDIFVVAVY